MTEPLTLPTKVDVYKCGEAWSIVIAHASGRTALVQGRAVPDT